MGCGTNLHKKLNDILFQKTVVLKFNLYLVSVGVKFLDYSCVYQALRRHISERCNIKILMIFLRIVEKSDIQVTWTCAVYWIIYLSVVRMSVVIVLMSKTWGNRSNCVLTANRSKGRSICIREQTVNTRLYGHWRSYILAQVTALGDEVKHASPHYQPLTSPLLQIKQSVACSIAYPSHKIY